MAFLELELIEELFAPEKATEIIRRLMVSIPLTQVEQKHFCVSGDSEDSFSSRE